MNEKDINGIKQMPRNVSSDVVAAVVVELPWLMTIWILSSSTYIVTGWVFLLSSHFSADCGFLIYLVL